MYIEYGAKFWQWNILTNKFDEYKNDESQCVDVVVILILMLTAWWKVRTCRNYSMQAKIWEYYVFVATAYWQTQETVTEKAEPCNQLLNST